MTDPVSDYSSGMLRIFLGARIHVRGPDKRIARAAVGRVIKRDAKITQTQFNAAVAGRPLDEDTRKRIWRALGVEAGE